MLNLNCQYVLQKYPVLCIWTELYYNIAEFSLNNSLPIHTSTRQEIQKILQSFINWFH